MELQPNQPTTWRFSEKILFRFCFIYFFLTIFPYPVTWLTFANFFTDFYFKIFSWLFSWTKSFFNSDSLFADYRIIFLLVALAGCIIWTIADRKRDHYKTLLYWLSVLIRYSLAADMFSYGFSKIFLLQFNPLFTDMQQLVQPYGDFSPQGLLWKYMSYSDSYQFFTGLAEVVGGILVLFRRTTLIGAIIIIGVMSNVAMINLGYGMGGIIVQSSHTIIRSLFLLVVDGKRLIRFFVLNKPVLPYTSIPVFTKKWMNYTKYVIKYGFILYAFFWNPLKHHYIPNWKQYRKSSAQPLYGIYNVENFILDKDTLQPLTTDTIRWRRFIVNYNGGWNGSCIQYMNDSLQNYILKIDSLNKTAVLKASTFNTPSDSSELKYTQYGNDMLIFEGKWKQNSVKIQMKKIDVNQFRIVRWDFRTKRGRTNF